MRSFRGPFPSRGPPDSTTRVGSPAVCESTLRMRGIVTGIYRLSTILNTSSDSIQHLALGNLDGFTAISLLCSNRNPGVVQSASSPVNPPNMRSNPGNGKQSTQSKTDHGNSLRKALHEIRELIVHGRLSPGSWIVEADLARHLAMSRTPVRSALHWLQREGYVIEHKNARKSRMVVAPLTKEDA